MRNSRCAAAAIAIISLCLGTSASGEEARMRARDYGIRIGVLPTGPLNAITDVQGVKVGHQTITGRGINTGVTAILPHGGNLFQDKVPAGISVANGFGKFAGSTQIEELGEIETPILLTNTLSVGEALSGGVAWTLKQPGNEDAHSVNVIVGETNDARLNDIRTRAIRPADAEAAIEHATGGMVEEGSVGAGRGTIAFSFKGGIGTSSRVLPKTLGGYTVGVLVQSNYGGILRVDGVAVGLKLGGYYLENELHQNDPSANGSVIIVIATDAPLSDRNLRRLASRAFVGIARTGSPITNGSGDYAVAFSTAPVVRRTPAKRETSGVFEELGNDAVSPLFEAVAEATEEAVLNSLFKARAVVGPHGNVPALPIEKVLEIIRSAGPGSHN